MFCRHILPLHLPVPVEFLLFALTLLGIALWHRMALLIAILGLLSVLIWQLGQGGAAGVPGIQGVVRHLNHEAVLLLNLLLLLTGFALLARHIEASRFSEWLPTLLPDDWTGGFWLLVSVFVLSAFLDNIAAALIGGAIARGVYGGRVTTGYLVALVAASNAGGAGSVLGDTTTTMMWLSGIAPLQVAHALVPALVSLLVFGVPAARIQQRHAPIQKDAAPGVNIDAARLVIAGLILLAALLGNLWLNLLAPAWATQLPCMGLAVWLTILLTSAWRRPEWSVLPASLQGAAFLLSLVVMASLMPVSQLPAPTYLSTALLGVVSAVFDNIPLTKLALQQGGYDWGLLAYAVGFGGSMLWFGSSAGVALCSQFPEARRTTMWLREGWPVILAYVVGVFTYVVVWTRM